MRWIRARDNERDVERRTRYREFENSYARRSLRPAGEIPPRRLLILSIA